MLSPPPSTQQLEQSLQKLGASQKQIDAWLRNILPHADTKTMLIAKQNWQALNLFLLLATQWRSERNKPTGIDYSAIAPTAQLAGITLSTSMFEKIRSMEQAALDIFKAQNGQQTNSKEAHRDAHRESYGEPHHA